MDKETRLRAYAKILRFEAINLITGSTGSTVNLTSFDSTLEELLDFAINNKISSFKNGAEILNRATRPDNE